MTLRLPADGMLGCDPAQGPSDFWRMLDHARALLGRDISAAARMLDECVRRIGDDPALAPGRHHALAGFCRTYGLPMAGVQPAFTATALPFAAPSQRRVGPFSATAEPGISLVTCCRNREANLLRALPSWLALPLAEIVVVDWTSDRPVATTLAEAGIADPRLVVHRVEGEDRWILSQAFNLGFRLARCATILKADADIVLSPDFLIANPVPPGRFIAGNWRTALPGQEYVNGFLLAARADLAAINGFNEYLTTYGWDDDDLYQRLLGNGLTRGDVAPGSVRHMDHDDEARLGESAEERPPLTRTPLYLTRINRLIAAALPVWDGRRELTRFDLAGGILRRTGPSARVPDTVLQAARHLAACEMLSWRAGAECYDLDPATIARLADLVPADSLNSLHVELARHDAPDVVLKASHFLLADLAEPPVGTAAVGALVGQLWKLAGTRQPVLRVPMDDVARIAAESGLPVLPLGDPPLGSTEMPAATGDNRHMPREDPAILRVQIQRDLAIPAIAHPRERLFVEVQHGLGNRLRAMGSAAAVAAATGRELVVVWTPDHHCQARLTDLIQWPGSVEETMRRPRRASFLNYMEAERGATKGAPLLLMPGRDAWLRSAYVVNHPASTWAAENRALQMLRPSAMVKDMLGSQPAGFDIGLHVRNEGAAGAPLASHDRAENWTAEAHAKILHWRQQSGAERFIRRLGTLLEERPGARVFLAADRAQTYTIFAEAFGDAVHRLDRPCHDRSVEQLRHAMADILLLARSRHLLRSNWSSFSEAAMRLSTGIERHETAGVDF